MLKNLVLVFVLASTFSCSSMRDSHTYSPDSNGSQMASKRSGVGTVPRNVVFFISDGTGSASFGLARGYQKTISGIPNLFLDALESGSVTTYSATSRITDSAASATAYAAGIKTYDGAIGVDINKVSVETVLEAAEKAGYNTALVSTARITHATPAAYSSHVPSRNMEAEIASQQVGQGIEILMGGGRSFYLPKEQGGLRLDGRNILKEAEEAGYSLVNNRSELNNASKLPILALFTGSHMAYEIDRVPEEEPSLKEMTEKALSLLSASDKPFFIMIEAGRIDHAGHANDVASHLHDVLAYDDAMKAAVDFAKADGRTLVLGTSDHETGGLSLGAQWGPVSSYSYNPANLSHMTSSIELFMANLNKVKSGSDKEVTDWVLNQTDEKFGFRSDAFQTTVRKMVQYREVTGDSAAFVHLRVMLEDSTARVARVGWASTNHSADDVPLFVYGPGSDAFKGKMDNTEVGKAIWRALGLN